MALRQLMIANKIKQRSISLNELLEREAALKLREADAETAIDEAKTEEEAQAVEAEIEAIEVEQNEIATQKATLEGEIKDLEGELEQLNSKPPVNNTEQEQPQRSKKTEGETRMSVGKFFNGMTREAVVALVERDEVKDFLTRTREAITQKRSITGAELNIPEVFLGLLRDNLHRYSKLITKVRLKAVGGKARQNIAGTIPEGVWTEAIGKLNELALSFNQIEVDGFKVGGFIPVPNSILEDSDLNLANEIMDGIGQAIGLAIDKAIVYGTGTKMPVGIATRLAQTSAPSDWGTYAPTWTDLHTSNIVKFDGAALTDDAKFFAALVLKLGIVEPNYASGGTFWAMSRKTKMTIMSRSLTFNAAGAIVAGQMGTMPVEGGEIIELDFIPENDIIGGFGSLYLLAERAGAQMAVSEHVKFIEDQTVFKGTARYDGTPVIGEGFVLVNIANTNPTTTTTFASDSVNP